MHKPLVVGLHGPEGVGKTTVARALVAFADLFSINGGGRVISFADALRDMLVALGVPVNALADRRLKVTPCAELGGATPRQAMRTLGTEWGRALAPDLWVCAWERRLGVAAEDWVALVAVDDVRYDNEAAAIRRAGGIVVWLRRNGVDFDNEHSSNMRLTDADYTVGLPDPDKLDGPEGLNCVIEQIFLSAIKTRQLASCT